MPVNLRRVESHPARGAWIEIISTPVLHVLPESHPARGAWIEMTRRPAHSTPEASRTPQGVRGLKFVLVCTDLARYESHPARGAWIEIDHR